ncbi:hypothetical protein P872_00065 [Rhodonellum psychrophilum GCM71 = DSM 17998]|uniref:Pseudouridine synthase n=2 Tax=Rhodonellum TaxID=336827 RepID=U5C122_9BACT|nr:hypothetical protein P872_00065 [Rhodonellum psychrophilum GCM71 = DSM 17998]SDY51466.1 23S rRNA pseudouridine2605 synthase [Rhodonellum ikkaensis]
MYFGKNKYSSDVAYIMKKDNSRNRVGKGPSTPRPAGNPKKGRSTGKSDYSSESSFGSRKPKSNDGYEKKAYPKAGRSDQGPRKNDAGDKKPYNPFTKESIGKKFGSTSESRFDNKKSKSNDAFERKPYPKAGRSDQGPRKHDIGAKKAFNKENLGRNSGSDSRFDNRNSKDNEGFERKSKPQFGRSDQGQKRYDSGDKKPFNPLNKDRGGRNTGNNSDSWSENRKPKRDGDFDRNSKPQSGRSDQGQKRYDSGDKKPFGPLSKDRGGKRDYNSDSRSENRSPKGDEGFDRNSKFDRGTKSDQNRSDFGGKSSTPESNPTEFTTVYKGRGRDEKPLFETVRKSEIESKAAPKRRFNRQPDLEDSIPTPKYNMERLEKKTGPNKETDVFRLNKYISNSGICSRRDADSLIERGDIRVNGEVVTELGFKVERRDFITYNGKSINPEKPVYILLNKPKDFITTTDDPMDRRTVMQLISNACEERVFPVGRLDRNTTGLLLFTNDGELAAKLSHPSNEIKKIYQVTLDKPITANDEEAILAGITLEDGDVKVDDMQVLSKDRTILGLEIHVGKNRIVRRIFAHFGYEVVGLDRVTYAGLTKRDLTRGKYRFLTEKEVINLKFFK